MCSSARASSGWCRHPTGAGTGSSTAAGNVLPFGDARFFGSPAGHLSAPVVGVTAFKSGYALYAVPASLPARPHAYLYGN